MEEAVKRNKMMSSKGIAEKTGKKHSNVIRDINALISRVKRREVFPNDKTDKSLEVGVDYQIVKDCRNYTSEVLLPEEVFNFFLKSKRYRARMMFGAQEEAALKTIEQLKEVSLCRQFKVLRYRVDGYDKVNNIVYEIDGPEHRTPAKAGFEFRRELDITNKLKCTFIRIQI